MNVKRYELNAAGQWVVTGTVPSLFSDTRDYVRSYPATGKNTNEGQNSDRQLFDL
jgi:hypothetical protein